MTVLIRLSSPEDAGAIARIAADAKVAAIEAESPRVRKILGESRTYVAINDDDVIGFVDGFFTRDEIGRRRYELDLLAVAREARGLGLGTRLTAECLAAAVEGGAQHARALVRGENAAMRKLCQRLGFHCSRASYALFVGERQSPQGLAPENDARLLSVDTLGYAGIWLEGRLSQEAIDAAHRLASQRNAAVIGAAIPSKALAAAALLRANAFRKVGCYHWWTINL